MTLTAEDIYSSQNGDRWRLMYDADTGQAFVRHEANASSGGEVTDTGVDDFLVQDGPGPEHAALRQLVAKLTGDE